MFFSAILGPHASTTVRVAVLPKSGQRSDRITFIARGSEQVRKEVIVDIESNYRTDSDAPSVDYTFTSDCTDVVLSKCEQGTWTIKVSAKDSESGMSFFFSISYHLDKPAYILAIWTKFCLKDSNCSLLFLKDFIFLMDIQLELRKKWQVFIAIRAVMLIFKSSL